MKKIIFLLLLGASLQAQTDYKKLKKDFIAEVKRYAIEIKYRYDIPVEVTIAIAALESGWGKNELARSRRNLLGIMKNGKLREFCTTYSCFIYFGKMLSEKQRYKPLRDCDNYRMYCIKLAECGYNPYQTYAAKLIAIIHHNKLDQL